MRTTILLALLLCACNSSKPPAQTAQQDTTPAAPAYTGPKACDLLSSDVVREVTGSDYKPGTVESDYGFDSQCKFEPADTTNGAVLVTLHAKGEFEPYKHVPNSFAVQNLGDDAIWNVTNNQLAIKKGEAVFSISFMKNAKQETAVKLGRSALEKL